MEENTVIDYDGLRWARHTSLTTRTGGPAVPTSNAIKGFGANWK